MLKVIISALLVIAPMLSDAAIVKGNPNGNITLSEVFDYQCIHCHRQYSNIQKIIESNPNLKVRLMPVAILNQNSLIEATATIAATQYPDGFDRWNNYALSGPVLPNEQISIGLKHMGFDQKDFVKTMHSHAAEEQLAEGMNLLKDRKSVV